MIKFLKGFESVIAGIPCRIHVTSDGGCIAGRDWGAPEDCFEDECEDPEYDVLDRKGYPAPWLEKKITDEINEEICKEILEAQEH